MSQGKKTQDEVMSLLLEYGYDTEIKIAGVTLLLAETIEDLKETTEYLKERIVKLEEK